MDEEAQKQAQDQAQDQASQVEQIAEEIAQKAAAGIALTKMEAKINVYRQSLRQIKDEMELHTKAVEELTVNQARTEGAILGLAEMLQEAKQEEAAVKA